MFEDLYIQRFIKIRYNTIKLFTQTFLLFLNYRKKKVSFSKSGTTLQRYYKITCIIYFALSPSQDQTNVSKNIRFKRYFPNRQSTKSFDALHTTEDKNYTFSLFDVTKEYTNSVQRQPWSHYVTFDQAITFPKNIRLESYY